MKKSPNLTQEEFDDLLLWFSSDRDEAGKAYLRVREGLIKYFRIKGCHDSQVLADETINRLARKLKTMDMSRGLKHSTYFYGFAKNIFLEYLAEMRKTPMQLEPQHIAIEDLAADGEGNEARLECLDKCMAELKPEDSKMMIGYFAKDKSEKIEARRLLAGQLNISMGNLHIKVYRLKNALRECLETCLAHA